MYRILAGFLCCNLCLLMNAFSPAGAQAMSEIKIDIHIKTSFQTIDNFAASDAWAAQYAGNWPEAKRTAIADWLFSRDTFPGGNPRGIGLSLWRFNLGAGSAGQGRESGIRDEWRRAASFGDTGSDRLAGQYWFLQAAKKRGVTRFLGFYNSPPIHLTKNGKAFATAGKCNIDSSRFSEFAAYTADMLQRITLAAGINVSYLSPVNEPQWDWSDGGQEGCPYTNAEISGLIKNFDQVFRQKKVHTQLLVSESGHLKYLLGESDKPGRGNQVNAFFSPFSPYYMGNLPAVAPIIAGHSYFSTSPVAAGVSLRNQLRARLDSLSGISFWQSEYCILGDNAGEITGRGKDTGITAALYLAKVIHTDLAEANATAWQWWTAISAYNYKDGLIYIDKNAVDGNLSDSKMLWALGNYSRFITPGMKRVAVNDPGVPGIFVSAYYQAGKGLVTVLINTTENATPVLLQAKDKKFRLFDAYATSSTERLARHHLASGELVLEAKSIVTVVMN